MKRNAINIAAGIIIGGFFLWLSVRRIDLSELWMHIGEMSYGWLIPFSVVLFLSYLFRALRWGLLMEHEGRYVSKRTLMAGVMFGHVVNYGVPRLGEISRSMLVAQSQKTSNSTILGTVVLERVIDLLVIAGMMFLVIVFIVADRQTFRNLFGEQAIDLLDDAMQPLVIIGILIALVIMFFLIWKLFSYIFERKKQNDAEGKESSTLFRIIHSFTDGLAAIRHLRRWPLFLTYTMLLWLCYLMMSYIPFYAFGMVEAYDLGIISAFAVMTISTIGVILPSPGAVGTYHWFVKHSLVVLYAVPAVNGLAFAFVTHAAVMFFTLLMTPVVVLMHYLRSAEEESEKS